MDIYNGIDPHPLLLAVFKDFKDKPFPEHTAERRFDSSGSLTGGPLKSSARHDRFEGVLDAIASVCVSKTSDQVVATSLTLPPDGPVVLCIAQNNEVPAKTIEFLNHLWSLLKTIADQNQSHLREKKAWSVVDQNTPLRHPLEKDILVTMNEATMLCYDHCYDKCRRRIMKRKDDFQKFGDVWDRDGSDSGDPRTLFKKLYSRLDAIMKLLDEDRGRKLSQPKIQKVVDGMKVVSDISQRLDENVLSKWNTQHTEKLTTGFGLGRYLKKCISLHISIVALFDFALSPRLSPVFTRILRITPIIPETRALKVPASGEEWGMYLEKVFQAANIEPDRELSENIMLTQPHGNAQVHCEALLLAHHHRQRHSVSPPMNYIGCSKLSCYACWKLFDAYNRPSSDKDYFNTFFTRGSHSKIYPCAIPDLEDEKANNHVRKVFFLGLCEDYGEVMVEHLGAKRRGSESSVGSFRPAGVRILGDMAKEVDDEQFS